MVWGLCLLFARGERRQPDDRRRMPHRCVGMNAPVRSALNKRILKGEVPSAEICDEWNALCFHVFHLIRICTLFISLKIVFYLAPILIILLNDVLVRAVVEQHRLSIV